MEAVKLKNLLDNTTVEKPCVKLTVKAVIVTDKGETVVGDNSIENKVEVCPRVEKNCPTGEGYELCKTVCNQGEHAEVSAIRNAQAQGINIKGARLFLTGHTYCCDNCISEMKAAGLVSAHCFDSGLNVDLLA